MAFEGLTQKLQNALGKMTGKGKLTEQDVKDGMREIRMALLEADVNYAVAKDFIKRVTEKCVGTEVLSSLTPSQQVMKIVNDELTATMGSTLAKLTWSSSTPTIYMLCGLQSCRSLLREQQYDQAMTQLDALIELYTEEDGHGI